MPTAIAAVNASSRHSSETSSATRFVVVDNCRAFSIVFNAAETATRAQPGGPVNSAFVAAFIDAVDQCALRETFINATGQPVVSGSVQKGVQIVGSVSGSQFDFTTFTSSPISGAVNVTLTPTDQPVLKEWHPMPLTIIGRNEIRP